MEMSNVILVCFFRNLANLKTFWSNDNPDRRFFGCKNVENGGKFYNLFLEYADKGSLVDHLQQNGRKLMESNVDIWALGCAVVEIFTGKLAWHLKLGANMVDFFIKIGANDELPRIPRELSGEGKDFMEKCFSRDLNKRRTTEMLLQHPFMASDDGIVPSTSSRGFVEEIIISLRCTLDFPAWISTQSILGENSSMFSSAWVDL
ncbi:hypothetical protein Golax_009050 [Gossypium laxum]|uniref:Protein kinase domain-containing protein n=2 Tax=Gossypium laxum TaxID=34288 RepID=A0A7J9ABZ4_9ROSI|nr:hypothetical protein [Gossypium laxum]